MSLDLTRRKFIATGTAAATLPFLGVDASAQAWPARPIKIVAGTPRVGRPICMRALWRLYHQADRPDGDGRNKPAGRYGRGAGSQASGA